MVQISASYDFALAVKADGTVWGWGDNSYGALGTLFTGLIRTPTQASTLSGITQVAAGFAHALFLKSDGTVWASGYNNQGQLGNGTTTISYTPIQVSSLTEVVQVATEESAYSSFALKSDGTVWAWGGNFYGRLGDGTTTSSNTPAQTVGLTGVVQLSAGQYRSFALKGDGTVWAWGDNTYGQLGDGTRTSSKIPFQLPTLSGITQISVGGPHTLALKLDGTIWAWGINSTGSLGDGTNTDQYSPVQVSGATGATNIAAGGAFSVAVYAIPSIYMNNVTFKYGKRYPLKARMYNSVLNQGIAGAPVVFKVDGVTVGTATTVDDGTGLTYASFYPYVANDTLALGNHLLTASYDGSNGTDLPSSTTVTLTIIQTDTNLIGVNAAAKLGDTIGLRSRLKRATDNNPIANQTIPFYVDGTAVGTGTSVAWDGLATFNGYDTSNLTVGTHTLTSQYAATTKYKASSSSATLTISKADTTLAVNDASRVRGQIQVLSARLWNTQNYNYLSGKTITFQIDGTVVGTGITGADGYARYSYKVPKNATLGAHTITAMFNGDTSYNASTGTGTLTVN